MKLFLIHPGASYATGDVFKGYARALAAQGHELLTYNLAERIDMQSEYLRFAYRRRKAGRPSWPEILTRAAMEIPAQALYHRPDWVVVFSAMYLAPDFLVLLKRAGLRVALVLSESPYDDAEQARLAPYCDVVFTNERTSVAALGPHARYLAHAYDPAVSDPTAPIPADVPHHDVLFVGTLFEERANLLAAVDWDGIDLALYGNVGILPSRHRLRKYVRGGVIPNDAVQYHYRAARINLNPYRTSRGFGVGVAHVSGAESLNPRALELAALGAFQISDWRAEVGEVFGTAVPVYGDGRNPRVVETLIRNWLGNDAQRAAYAARARAAARGHTYAARAAELTATLAGHGSRGRIDAAVAAD